MVFLQQQVPSLVLLESLSKSEGEPCAPYPIQVCCLTFIPPTRMKLEPEAGSEGCLVLSAGISGAWFAAAPWQSLELLSSVYLTHIIRGKEVAKGISPHHRATKANAWA